MDCATGPLTIENILRRVIWQDGGCGALLTASPEGDTPLDCVTKDYGLQTLFNMLFSPGNSALLAGYVFGPEVDYCDSILPRNGDCTDAGLETMIKEAIRLGPNSTASINFMGTPFSIPCIGCDDVETPLRTRIASTFVRYNGATHVLIAGMDGSPLPLDCTNEAMPTSALLASALVPLNLCGLWAWRAIQI